MKSRFFILVVLALAFSGCRDNTLEDPKQEVRQYLFSVEINTPDGVVSSEGSMLAKIQIQSLKHGQRRLPRLNGEAIPIRLKDGRYIFMLVSSLRGAWGQKAPWVDDWKSLEDGQKVELNEKGIPSFGYFSNINDPKTHQKFEWYEISKFIGEGYNLKKITIQRTNKKTKPVIDEVIPWLRHADSSSGTGRFCRFEGPYKVRNCVGTGFFKRTETVKWRFIK